MKKGWRLIWLRVEEGLDINLAEVEESLEINIAEGLRKIGD